MIENLAVKPLGGIHAGFVFEGVALRDMFVVICRYLLQFCRAELSSNFKKPGKYEGSKTCYVRQSLDKKQGSVELG